MERVVEEVFKKERDYAKTLQLTDLRKQIYQMTLQDQQLRFRKAQAGNDSIRAVLDSDIVRSDLENQKAAKDIILQYGWPKISQIGKDGQNNLWLIVQHADQDVRFQKAELQAMEQLIGNPKDSFNKPTIPTIRLPLILVECPTKKTSKQR